ncbi:DUF4479 and tRNA-binding domain-containing protein [Enterococcus saccharolyticus]|uniref:tRNA-binding protein n=1 Tax=Candidatus Enterococcus willemsii TaxID=1857215 RepID=A0ABQ6YWU7_9ENTE|nr:MULTISPECIES: DUF4479 and tRNA-binding domain-containing protein [Enterococcus]KAF1301949.1 tRNA-binding protein [Enterococcus sp. CU12B]MCD5002944.1 DUF4479 and tRNA-binding domain-containing protein [Enterococcus saccharolyticus]
MIFAYNPKYVSDTLMVITDNDKNLEQTVERKGNVACLKTEDGRIIGWNFFAISEVMTIEGNGQVYLSDEQVAKLNELMRAAGFTEQLTPDHEPKFVVGFVKSCEPHEDSDHLSITEIEVDNNQTLQIVCGAPNIRKGLKVVVAKPGAMMPDGMLIWPGELRGVASYGMVCSAKELHLPNAPMKRGILELGNDAVVGEAFTVGK